jgi:hypothetical protein
MLFNVNECYLLQLNVVCSLISGFPHYLFIFHSFSLRFHWLGFMFFCDAISRL